MIVRYLYETTFHIQKRQKAVMDPATGKLTHQPPRVEARKKPFGCVVAVPARSDSGYCIGVSMCGPDDSFSKKRSREIAGGRALCLPIKEWRATSEVCGKVDTPCGIISREDLLSSKIEEVKRIADKILL